MVSTYRIWFYSRSLLTGIILLSFTLVSMFYCSPTEKILPALNELYKQSRIKFSLDTNLSHFDNNSYGRTTYFTVYTQDVVIVAIRGTQSQSAYDWMVDLDVWMESFVYKVGTSSNCCGYSAVSIGDIKFISMVEVFSRIPQ